MRGAMRGVAVVVALVAMVAPAEAADPSLSHFAHLMAEAAVGENAPELSVDFTASLSAGAMPLAFETTSLKDLATQFGGDLHATVEATGTVSWLCYARPAAAGKPALTVWFISQNPALTLNMLVAQATDATAHDGCGKVPNGLTLGATGVEPLGVTAAALQARFGSLPYDKVRNVYYDSTRPKGDGSGKSIYQRLGYALQHGRVIALAIGQTTN